VAAKVESLSAAAKEGKLGEQVKQNVGERRQERRAYICTEIGGAKIGVNMLHRIVQRLLPIARRALGHMLVKMAKDTEGTPLYPAPADDEEKELWKAEGRTPMYTLRVLRDGMGEMCVQAKDVVRVLAIRLLKPSPRRKPGEKLARGASFIEERLAKVNEAAAAETQEEEVEEEAEESIDPNEMPEEFKPIASQVTAADVDLELTFVLGDEPFRFQVCGEKWFTPTLALFTLKYFALNARARIWWDTKGGVLKIAFLKAVPPECSWESDLKLLGLSIPFNVQDILVPLILRFVLSRFTVASPLTVDLKKPEEQIEKIEGAES